ncbi:hypothetical protein CJ030_MR2G011921 [Morella rubra]|uniref:Uncharacterized protein n=1 Tax=Morella rubra TaxID=262757 RepID=A0A6A1WD08_9ROSI|nr:hypothetical protein CJ030_MR2G011921 [Morella rubra]
MDPDYLTIVEFNSCVKDLGYMGVVSLCEGANVIDVYVEHTVDVPTFVDDPDLIDYVPSQYPPEVELEDEDAEEERAKHASDHGVTPSVEPSGGEVSGRAQPSIGDMSGGGQELMVRKRWF